MPRDIDYIGQTVTIEDYEEQHRPDAQELVEGVPLNPCLRPGFDSTPNEERDPQEIDDWWNLPYIQAVAWDDFESDDAERRQSWFAHWPSGTRYDVRCLDGGAWDRSTSWGQAATLEAALEIARTGPAWRRSIPGRE